jgi:hypothetical protein
MLEQIICDKFTEKTIFFHKGLNVVMGDDLASNSIGKSTLLMIIDFAFGGSDYIKKNHDAIEALGSHEFNFIFSFNGNKLYFTRSTSNHLYISICNERFETQSVIKLDDYNSLLQNEYACQLDGFSFRSVIGRYFRVYGKENLNERKPIQYFEKETAQKSILALVQLFDKYKPLRLYEENISTFTEERELLNGAAKKDLIPNVSKTIFKRNVSTITNLSDQLENLKADIINSSIDIESLISKEILQLKKKKSALIIQKNVLDARLKRVKTNLANKSINFEAELDQFVVYFPNFNIEQVKKVDTFHNNLTQILKSELLEAEKEISTLLSEIDVKMTKIDVEISGKLNIQNVPKFAVDKVVDLVAQIQQLNNENGYFNKRQSIDEDLSRTKKDLSALKEKVLDDICNQINTKMYELNKEIYADKRRAPTLNIHGSKYVFSTYGDTGTGTAFANLISFDLALLNLTCLPAIAHDLPLLKNIENPALEKIVALYALSQKQIFIAIDKVNSYDSAAAKLIEKQRVIQLSKDKTLFIKNWKSDIK